uniref:acyltransferase Pun1-like n=1 Tax=Erigeron canadensis TaxID=72917 RepID=UPI001CB91639|nr:acyltransferase Pun1-like [Erigeron canadensis]
MMTSIISRELIKPASPTPFHLRDYNLSPLDQLAPEMNVPVVFFYPDIGNCTLEKTMVLKKSLSQSLTQYYPCAGRLHSPKSASVNCNDKGVLFVEAKNEAQMDTFHDSENIDTLYQLFPDDLVYSNCSSLVGVQLNHFACGGIGLAVSMSHLIGDGHTLGSFVSHWASVARYGSLDHKEVLPFNPHFIHTQLTNSMRPEYKVINQKCVNPVTKKFLFPNSKLSDLRNKVISSVKNPTRVEVLSSLLYKTAMAAATQKSGSLKPSYLYFPVDIRNKFIQKFSQTSMGNFVSVMIISTMNTSETSLDMLVSEIRKKRLLLERFQSVQQAAENRIEILLSKLGDAESAKTSYWCLSLCGFPSNHVDFGWGKPMDTTSALKEANMSGFLLTDAPYGAGIEALVILEKEIMAIFENDKEMLSFCQIN